MHFLRRDIIVQPRHEHKQVKNHTDLHLIKMDCIGFALHFHKGTELILDRQPGLRRQLPGDINPFGIRKRFGDFCIELLSQLLDPGGLIPGSPYAVFPIAGGLYQAGAGLGAMVGFISAWSLWSISRLPVEIALISPKAAFTRYAITFIFPPIAGLAAHAFSKIIR